MQFKSNITNLASIQDQYQTGLNNFKVAKSKMFNNNLNNATNPQHATHSKLMTVNGDSMRFVSKFSGMKLEQLKNSLEKNLQILDLSNNRFTYIPKEVYLLPVLSNFQINNNFIDYLPQDFFPRLSRLTTLGLASNLLVSLPKGIHQLRSLTTLLLSYNRLQLLDPDIFALPSLAVLLVQGNEYQSLPFQVLHLAATLKLLGFGWPQLLDQSHPILLKDYHLQLLFHVLTHIQATTKAPALDFLQYLSYMQNHFTYDRHALLQQKPDDLSSYIQHSQESFNEHIEDRQLLNNPDLKLELNQDLIPSDPNFTKSQYVPTNTMQSQLIETHNSRFGVDFLESQADRLDINYLLSSPLDTVEENKEESLVKEEGVLDLNVVNENKQNLMHLAILAEEIGVLRFLMVKAKELMDEVDSKNHTPLSLSIERQRFRVTGFLLLNGADVKLGGGQKHTNLHLSGLLFQGELAKDLVSYGMDPNTVDQNGETVLHCVAKSIQFQKVTEFFEVMLRLRAKVGLVNHKGQSCVEILVEKGNLNTLKWLRDKSEVNFGALNQRSGKSLVHVAIQNYHLHVFLYLVNEGLVSLVHVSDYIDVYSFLMTVLFKFPGKSFSKLKIIMKVILAEQRRELRSRFQARRQDKEQSINEEMNGFSEDDCVCSNEECEGLSQTLKRLKAIQPKFKNSNVSAKLTDSDPDTPSDEFMHAALHENNKSQTKSSSRIFDKHSHSLTSRLSRQLVSMEKPRQINLSPNNISTIRERNNLLHHKSPIQTLEFNMAIKNLRSFVQNFAASIQHLEVQRREHTLDHYIEVLVLKSRTAALKGFLRRSPCGVLFSKGNKVIDPQLWDSLEKLREKCKVLKREAFQNQAPCIEDAHFQAAGQLLRDFEHFQSRS